MLVEVFEVVLIVGSGVVVSLLADVTSMESLLAEVIVAVSLLAEVTLVELL